MEPHGCSTSTMQRISVPAAISTNAQPKLPITQLRAFPMTEPRLVGANRPQPTKPAISAAEPQKTAGSTSLRYRFMYAPPEGGLARDRAEYPGLSTLGGRVSEVSMRHCLPRQ